MTRISKTFRVVRRYKSKSNPLISHQVRIRDRDSHLYCTCRGYCSHGACKHLKAFLGVPTLTAVRYNLASR